MNYPPTNKRQKLFTALKVTAVVVISVVITSLTIDATDTFNGGRSFLGAAGESLFKPEVCTTGMVFVPGSNICIDQYEVSPSKQCSLPSPASASDTARNIETVGCVAESKSDAQPWRFVTYNQAKQLCALSGKRLPSNEEWFGSALGTRDGGGCVLTGDLTKTDPDRDCRSAVGAYDMVGNVWEFVAETTKEGTVNGEAVPDSGYVALVDAMGVPRESTTTPQAIYSDDYLWHDATKSNKVVMRGGYYGSGRDGGIYSMQAELDTNFAGPGVGFRCVTDSN